MKNNLFKKCVCILIIFTILVNLIPNLGVFSKISYAAEATTGIVIKPGVSEFKEVDGKTIYKLNIYLRNVTTGIWYIDLNYNSNNMVPARVEDEDTEDALAKQATKADQAVTWTDESELFILETGMDRELKNNADGTGNIYFGGISATDEEIEATGDLLICTINFMIKNSDMSIGDITVDDFSIGMEKTNINIDYEDCFAEDYPEYFSFEGFATQPEEKKVQSLSISGIAAEYIVGDKLDLASIKITKTYNDTNSSTEEATLNSVLNDTTNYDVKIINGTNETALTAESTLKIGDKLKVIYKGTDKVDGEVSATAPLPVREEKITKIEFQGFETSYKQGDTIDLSKISVIATYEKAETGTKTLDNDKYTLSATGNSIVGNKITLTNAGETAITATLKEDTSKVATHTITITEKVLDRIEVTAPTKDVYTVGENLSLEGMEVKAIYDNGEKPTVTDYTTSIANGAELSGIGVQTITVTYNGKSAEFDIVVFPTKLVGTEGEDLSTVDSTEDFEWVTGNAKLSVGESTYLLKYTNTDPQKERTCNVKVLGIPSNLTAIYGQTLADVKYNGTVTLPTEGFDWETPATSVGNAGDNKEFNIKYNGSASYGETAPLKAKVNVAKKTLTKNDITTNPALPKSDTYNGTKQGKITVNLPDGAGTPTIKFYKDGVETDPINAGEYTVKVSVSVGTNYTALEKTALDNPYLIGKARLEDKNFDISGIPTNNTKPYDGNPVTVTATIMDTVPGVEDIRNTVEAVKVKYYKKEDNGTETPLGEGEKPTEVGKYTVKVNVIGGENYWPADGTPGNLEIRLGSFSITKKQLTKEEIEIAPKTFTYNGATQTPTVAPKANVEGAGTIVATYWQGNTQVPNPTDAGKYTVKITTTGATNYENVADMDVGEFTIEQAEIPVDHINVTAPAAKTYDGKPSVATATLDETVPGAEDVTIDVTYVDGDENPVTNPTDAGTYTVKVSSNGGKNYKPLAETATTKTIVINKVTLSETDIQCTLPEKLVYDNNSKKATIAVVKDLGEDKTLTVDAKDITVKYYKDGDAVSTATTDVPVNAGTYNVLVSVSAGKNYEALAETMVKTYKVEKATPAKNDFMIGGIPDGGSKAFDGNPVIVTATQLPSIKGETLSTEIKYYSSSDAELPSAPSASGTYKAKLIVAEGTNYSATEINLGTFTINPQGFDKSKINYTKTLVYDNKIKTKDDVNIKIIDDDSAVISNVKFYQNENQVDAKDVGTYTITANIDSDMYEKMTDVVIGTFEITQREITVEIGNAESIYGEEFNEATVSIAEETLATGDTIENVVELTKAEGTDVGTYNITGKSINDNYKVTFANIGTYTIKPMPITVKIGNIGSVYGETEATLNDSLITLADGIVLPYGENISDLKITLTKEAGTDVGTYDIRGESSNENYDITYVDGEYEITKATLVPGDFTSNIPTEGVTFGTTVDIKPTYNNGITIEDAGKITVKYYKDGVETNPTEVGTYTVKVSTPGGDNYYPADGISTDDDGNVFGEITLGEFRIVRSTEKPNITITPPTENTYDGNEKEPTINNLDGVGEVTITYYKKEEDGTETLLGADEKPIDAGEYVVKATTTGGDNYDPMEETKVGEFTINPREIEVTIEDKTSIYGDTLETLTSNITDGELVEGDDLGITLNKEEGTDADDYSITGTSTNTNYKVTFVDGTYTITARAVTISIDNKGSAIKEDLKELTYEVTEGTEVVAKEAVELKTNANKNTVGTYDITVKSTNNNYTVTIANTDEKGIYTIKDKVEKIILSKNEITADCGTSLEDLINDITYQVVYVGAGAQPAVALDKDMITTTYNPNITASQTLTVEYTDNDANSATNGDKFTADLTVTLSDALQSITVTTTDKNVNYYEGQTFNKEGMVVTANYAVANSRAVDNYKIYVIRDGAEVEITSATTLKTSDEKIIVKYTENETTVYSEEITIDVKEDEIVDITFNFNGEKTYNCGDSIDLGTSTVTKVWASGLTHANDTIPMTKDMLSIKEQPTFDFDSINKVGTHTVTVTVDGIESENTFEITVKDEVAGIEIEDKTKLQKDYFYGDPIKVTDKDTEDKLYVLVKYAGDTPDERVELTASMISVENTNVENGKVVTVTYRDNKGKPYTDTFEINVKDYIKAITVTNNKSLYKIGESGVLDIDVNGIWASNSTTKPIAIDLGAIDTSSEGSKTITVSYVNEKGATLTKDVIVKVVDATEEIFTSNLPKQDYKYGEALSLANGTITVKTLSTPDGKTIPMTDASITVTGYNPKQLDGQTLTIKYTYTEETETGTETKTWTDTYGVNVADYETGYKVTPPSKTTYDYGMPLDLAGATVSKVWASGKTTNTVEISGEMISEYNATVVGAQTIKVSAFGEENVGSFVVTVVDRTLGISMKELPNKTEYTQGEAIDVSGAVLNVTKSSGIKEIAITKEMISGYNPNKVGTQVITVTYDGKQTEFVINVKEAPKKPNKPTNSTKPSTSEVEKYTVTFINYDGKVIKTEEVVSGKSATAPEVEARPGYKFIGWNRNFDAVEEDLTVMAKYEEVKRAEVNAPDNMEVEQGEDIDLSEVTLKIFDEDGNEIDEIPVTEDMISGFDSEKIGTQVVTVTYVDKDGVEYTATFKVKVVRPAEVLGVKDEVTTEENNLNGIIVPAAVGAGSIGLLLILIGLATRKNVEIYAVTEDERKLIGKEKLTKRDRRIVLDGYEKKLKDANIEIVLNKKITRKLDEEMIDIVFRGKKSTYKVKDMYGEEFTIKMKNI